MAIFAISYQHKFWIIKHTIVFMTPVINSFQLILMLYYIFLIIYNLRWFYIIYIYKTAIIIADIADIYKK